MAVASERIAEINIYDTLGRRKYLTGAERRRFKATAEALPRLSERNFCLMLYYTGCRISEALELVPERIDTTENTVIIRTLKRRSDSTFRAIPLPSAYLSSLSALAVTDEARLWPIARKTGYRIIKGVMEKARISGPHATPKGLRHGFGIACAQNDIPLPTIAKWMGHSKIETTAIYLNAVGREERKFAKRIW